MKALPSRVLLAITCCAWLAVACSKDDDGSPDDVNASGGTVSASGGAQASVLDRDRLAANCAGLEVAEGESCGEAELVCEATSGALCICGGVPPETGQVQGNDDNDWRGPRSGSGGTTAGPDEQDDSDLSWVCYAIGPPPQGDGGGDGDGEGGETNQGGQGGAF